MYKNIGTKFLERESERGGEREGGGRERDH